MWASVILSSLGTCRNRHLSEEDLLRANKALFSGISLAQVKGRRARHKGSQIRCEQLIYDNVPIHFRSRIGSSISGFRSLTYGKE